MNKFQAIAGGSWEQATILPESVPHLLHQDLTYLWVLEKAAEQRPKAWNARVEAWRQLVRLFFLDQVDIARETLHDPLLAVATRFGIDQITWLRHKQTNQPIGVLSPTVLVRPLPDFVELDLPRWRPEARDGEDDFRHLLYVAINDLERDASNNSFRTRLTDILKREFNPAPAARRAPMGRSVAVPVLQTLMWERREGDRDPIGSVSVAVRAGSSDLVEHTPRCAACNALLMFDPTADAVLVTQPTFAVTCTNRKCTSPHQTMNLEDFGVWLRGTEAILWTPERIPATPDLKLAPAPHIVGSELVYEWNAAAVGEPRQRFLRLLFPERTVRQVQLMSIFFDRLIIPGKLKDFRGLPIDPEWIDAVDTSTIDVRASADRKQIEFRALKVRGWPARFTKTYSEASLQQEPSVSVGLYPDPSIVGPEWKWFRSFVHGTGTEALDLVASSGRPLTKALREHEDGLPQSVGLRSSATPTAGVSFVPSRREWDEKYGGTATAQMAIDFGTTNTLVYYQPPGARLVARAGTHALNPRSLSQKIFWFAETDAWKTAPIIGGFLPGNSYRQRAADPFTFPSEVWRVGDDGFHLIRWGGDHPEGRTRPALDQFKWDSVGTGATGYAETRHAYLREILLLSAPAVIAAAYPARVKELQIGVAFPLAFSMDTRQQFRHMITDLGRELQTLTGLPVDTGYSINESKACVNAFGYFHDQTFLIADMGGGTLDVALFSFEGDARMQIHQMGSLRFAGEHCVKVLAAELTPPGDIETRRRALRDAIAAGSSHQQHGTHPAERIAVSFATAAFEFLRIMIAAFRNGTHKIDPISVVLVGNGWHLIEAVSTETGDAGPRRVYSETLGSIVKAIGEPNVRLYEERPLSELPSSKHLVAIGALQNVTDTNTSVDELEEPRIAMAKLPVGRPLHINDLEVPWDHLVGEGISLPGNLDSTTISQSSLRVDARIIPPFAGDAWRARLCHSLGVDDGVPPPLPYPSEPDLQRELRNGLSGSPPKLRRGPMQIVLEVEWVEAIGRSRGSIR
ncbi:MAG TPA: hypothetical protein VGQ46_18390 [Thermoanaerobaculia bacterium]|jgi:hypothetical protein|nr:hypothetical protein [Thermoanaerobaculia bacterium]